MTMPTPPPSVDRQRREQVVNGLCAAWVGGYGLRSSFYAAYDAGFEDGQRAAEPKVTIKGIKSAGMSMALPPEGDD